MQFGNTNNYRGSSCIHCANPRINNQNNLCYGCTMNAPHWTPCLECNYPCPQPWCVTCHERHRSGTAIMPPSINMSNMPMKPCATCDGYVPSQFEHCNMCRLNNRRPNITKNLRIRIICPECHEKTVGEGYDRCYDCNAVAKRGKKTDKKSQRIICPECHEKTVGEGYDRCYDCNAVAKRGKKTDKKSQRIICPECKKKAVGKGFDLCYDCNTVSSSSVIQRKCGMCKVKPVGEDYENCYRCNNPDSPCVTCSKPAKHGFDLCKSCHVKKKEKATCIVCPREIGRGPAREGYCTDCTEQYDNNKSLSCSVFNCTGYTTTGNTFCDVCSKDSIGHPNEGDDEHSYEGDDEHSHEGDDEHSHEGDDEHSHEGDDEHSHEGDDKGDHEECDGILRNLNVILNFVHSVDDETLDHEME